MCVFNYDGTVIKSNVPILFFDVNLENYSDKHFKIDGFTVEQVQNFVNFINDKEFKDEDSIYELYSFAIKPLDTFFDEDDLLPREYLHVKMRDECYRIVLSDKKTDDPYFQLEKIDQNFILDRWGRLTFPLRKDYTTSRSRTKKKLISNGMFINPFYKESICPFNKNRFFKDISLATIDDFNIGPLNKYLLSGDIVIAGGSLLGVVKDIDVFFICSQKSAKDIIKETREWFDNDKSYNFNMHVGPGYITFSQYKIEALTEQDKLDIDSGNSYIHIHKKTGKKIVDGTYIQIQFITRLYNSPSEIVHGFDLGASSLLYDGKNIWGTKRCVHCLKTNNVYYDSFRGSSTYYNRLRKYMKYKGFNLGNHSPVKYEGHPTYSTRSPFINIIMKRTYFRENKDAWIESKDHKLDYKPKFNKGFFYIDLRNCPIKEGMEKLKWIKQDPSSQWSSSFEPYKYPCFKHILEDIMFHIKYAELYDMEEDESYSLIDLSKFDKTKISQWKECFYYSKDLLYYDDVYIRNKRIDLMPIEI